MLTRLKMILSFFRSLPTYQRVKDQMVFLGSKPARYNIYADVQDGSVCRAYNYFLSYLVPPVLPAPSEEEARMFKRILFDYNVALKELTSNEDLEFFIGKDWHTYSVKAMKTILETDKESLFTIMGARSYKTMALTNSEFNPVRHSSIVETATGLYDEICKTYKIEKGRYQGYRKYYYPNILHDGDFLNPASLHSIESAAFLSEKIEKEEVNIIAEIGAGDGSVCRDMFKNFKMKYIILDLPEMLVRSHLFLQTYYPGLKISLLSDYNACGNFKDALKECDILILPCWKIADLKEQKLDVDLWINTHSLGEMPLDISSYYCKIINHTGGVNHGCWRE